MGNISRRDFLAVAAVLGAEAAWGRSFSTPSKISWHEASQPFPGRCSLRRSRQQQRIAVDPAGTAACTAGP